ncbi:MAG: hypothetical protein ACPGU7_02095 [Gammaproteobacteria bacterium]
MPIDRKRVLLPTLVYGVISVTLYVLLYLFNEQVLEYSRQGGWYFVIPLTIAFGFSIVHGNFTGKFWDLFGIKPKTTKK